MLESRDTVKNPGKSIPNDNHQSLVEPFLHSHDAPAKDKKSHNGDSMHSDHSGKSKDAHDAKEVHDAAAALKQGKKVHLSSDQLNKVVGIIKETHSNNHGHGKELVVRVEINDPTDPKKDHSKDGGSSSADANDGKYTCSVKNDVLVVEVDPEALEQSKERKSKAREEIAKLQAHCAEKGVQCDVPAELIAELNQATPAPQPRVVGGDHPMPQLSFRPMPSTSILPKMELSGTGSAAMSQFNPGSSVGRTDANMSSEQQAFNSMKLDREFTGGVDGLHAFLDRVVNAVSGNEGGFTSYNPNDNGCGISIGKAQWNQKAGELPSLLKHWYDANQNKFNEIFGTHAAEITNNDFQAIRNLTITPGLEQCLKTALADPEFQQVQTQMLREKALNAYELSHKYNHGSELFVAEVADIANQMGWGGVESALKRANIANISDEHAAIEALKNATEGRREGGGHRDLALAKLFSPDKPATLNA